MEKENLDLKENKEIKKVTLETIQEFMNLHMGKSQEIKFRDNEKNITYKLWKNDKQCSITVEKTLQLDDEFNNLFNELKEYSNSIGDISKFYPNPNIESPDLMILWEICTKFDEENKLRGALHYPENWDNIMQKLEKEIMKMINK